MRPLLGTLGLALALLSAEPASARPRPRPPRPSQAPPAPAPVAGLGALSAPWAGPEAAQAAALAHGLRRILGPAEGGRQLPPEAWQLAGVSALWPEGQGLAFNDPGRWVRQWRPGAPAEVLAGGALYRGMLGLRGPALGGLGLPAGTGPVGRDAQGRLLLAGPLCLLAVGPGQEVEALWPIQEGKRLVGAWLGAQGHPELVVQQGEALGWWRLEASGWRELQPLGPELSRLVLQAEGDAGVGPLALRGAWREGRWLLRVRPSPELPPLLLAVDLARRAAAPVGGGTPSPQRLAPSGLAFALVPQAGGQRLLAWPPGGPVRSLAEGLPATWTLHAAAEAPGGGAWLALGPHPRAQALVLAQGGRWRQVAGRLGRAHGQPEALDLALAGLAAAPDGGWVVAARLPAQVMRLPPSGGPVQHLAALPPEVEPVGLAIAAEGQVMLNDRGRSLWRVDGQGARQVFRAPEGQRCAFLCADGPAGFALWLRPAQGSGSGQLLRLDARGSRSYAYAPAGLPQGLASDGGGRLWALAWRPEGLVGVGWPRAGGAAHRRSWLGLRPPATGPEGGLVVDPEGRFLLASASPLSPWRRQLWRLGPQGVERLAGHGAPLLGQEGLDEGLRSVEALARSPQGELALASGGRVWAWRPEAVALSPPAPPAGRP